jgi:hypothetical protein
VTKNRIARTGSSLNFEIAKYLKSVSNLAKTRRAEEENVIIKITSLSQRSPAGLSGRRR